MLRSELLLGNQVLADLALDYSLSFSCSCSSRGKSAKRGNCLNTCKLHVDKNHDLERRICAADGLSKQDGKIIFDRAGLH